MNPSTVIGPRALLLTTGLAAGAAELGEGLFVGVEELGQRLVGAAPIKAAPTEAQGEDKDVEHPGLGPERDRGRPPQPRPIP